MPSASTPPAAPHRRRRERSYTDDEEEQGSRRDERYSAEAKTKRTNREEFAKLDLVSQQGRVKIRENDTRCIACTELPRASYPYYHHNSSNLKRSADAGCDLCQLFLDTLPSIDTQHIIKVEGHTVFISSGNKVTAFELFTTREAAAASTETSTTLREIRRSSKSHACFELAREWLTECLVNHNHCHVPRVRSLPRRLLDLHGARIKLVDTININLSFETQYTALSYCWGTNENLVMTRSNKQVFERGVDPKTLPRTISHAVKASRQLGIRYLWVDALCIIQDDHVDWQVECSRMAQTYRHCQVMLSALDSTGADPGFLGRRKPEPQALWQADTEIWIRTRLPLVKTVFERAALSQRGWTFQERMLAPRILHFSNQELFWECETCFGRESSSERRHDRSTQAERFKDAISATDAKVLDPEMGLLTLWYVNVSVFSQRAMTRKSDKIIALAGVAAIVEEKSGFTHVCGIWPQDIYSLLWTRFPTMHRLWNGPQLETTLDFPSWTWASMDCRVVYEISGSERTPSIEDASILDVSSQTLTLQGESKPVVVLRDTDYPADSQVRLWRGWIHNHKMTSAGLEEHYIATTIDHAAAWDMAQPTQVEVDTTKPWRRRLHELTSLRCHAIFIARMLSPRTPQHIPSRFFQSSQSWFLLVVPNDDHTWRRIGLGFVDADVGDTDARGFFADSGRRTFEIV